MNTLYLESLKYGIIMQAKRILKTIEEGCMKCIRRKKQYLKARVGQPHEASFSDIIRPFEYIQMDLTGRHITEGEKMFMGLCVYVYKRITPRYMV